MTGPRTSRNAAAAVVVRSEIDLGMPHLGAQGLGESEMLKHLGRGALRRRIGFYGKASADDRLRLLAECAIVPEPVPADHPPRAHGLERELGIGLRDEDIVPENFETLGRIRGILARAARR